jgi:single-stranded-DNA-specific exonuclease
MSEILTKQIIRATLEERFCTDSVRTLSSLPKPSIFVDMDKATRRVAHAIVTKQKVVIVGDYDVDGIVSTSLVKIFFDEIGFEAEYIIPNRFVDGYGLSNSIIDRIDAELVITVDNGIMAHNAADILAGRGVDLIILDHHTIAKTLPKALAVIHPCLTEPRLETHEICAATVVWYFIAALKMELAVEFDMKSILHLVAIATIADVMPLVCINRTIVRAGLLELNNSMMPFALIARQKLSKGRFAADDIAYKLAPRLNSAGRMADGKIAFEFLTARTISTAKARLEELNALNEERKKIELFVFEEAQKQIIDGSKIAVVYGEDWHEGVLGIAASRIAHKYGIPAVVLCINGERAKGSARGVGQISIYDLLNGSSQYLSGFGGHKLAAGLNLHSVNIEEFKENIANLASKLDSDLYIHHQDYLGELELSNIDLELCVLLESFEPYGQANEKPKFFAHDKYISKIEIIGKDQNVSRLGIKDEPDSAGLPISAVYFGCKEELEVGGRANFTYSVVKNSWGGIDKAELLVQGFL